jgi:hypothetical protein
MAGDREGCRHQAGMTHSAMAHMGLVVAALLFTRVVG